MSDYPNTYYEIRTNYSGKDEFYTLGSCKTLKKAKEGIDWWRKTSPKRIWEIAKAINIMNGVIERIDINY